MYQQAVWYSPYNGNKVTEVYITLKIYLQNLWSIAILAAPSHLPPFLVLSRQLAYHNMRAPQFVYVHVYPYIPYSRVSRFIIFTCIHLSLILESPRVHNNRGIVKLAAWAIFLLPLSEFCKLQFALLRNPLVSQRMFFST